tara:strand:+ start:1862 stop:2425 length:564 start_codon:yes stop_codon:yes gene_type:complete
MTVVAANCVGWKESAFAVNLTVSLVQNKIAKTANSAQKKVPVTSKMIDVSSRQISTAPKRASAKKKSAASSSMDVAKHVKRHKLVNEKGCAFGPKQPNAVSPQAPSSADKVNIVRHKRNVCAAVTPARHAVTAKAVKQKATAHFKAQCASSAQTRTVETQKLAKEKVDVNESSSDVLEAKRPFQLQH